MEALVKIDSGKVTVNSKVVSDNFGKVHRSVLRDIRELGCSENFRQHNFVLSSYRSSQGKELPCYEMTRDGFCFLAMGFTGEKANRWKEDFLAAFNAMEDVLSKKSLSPMDHFGEAIAIYESDKEKASLHGKALSQWKRIRKQHIEAVTAAHEKAQLVLNFKPTK